MFYKVSRGQAVQAEDIYPYDLQPWDAMKAIDDFYKDEKNRYVPAAYALTVINMRETGKTDIEINGYKEKIRQELSQ